jgi:hypothetical protein
MERMRKKVVKACDKAVTLASAWKEYKEGRKSHNTSMQVINQSQKCQLLQSKHSNKGSDLCKIRNKNSRHGTKILRTEVSHISQDSTERQTQEL